MYGEGLPEIPRQEHPEHEWLKKEAEKAVVEKVTALDIGLDLDKHPKLRSRLAEIGSHFEDSLDMARIIKAVYPELREKLDLPDEDPSRMMRAAVLHDIGKSGPLEGSDNLNFAVRKLFVPPGRPFNPFIDGRAKTVSEFLAEQSIADKDKEKVLDGLKSAGIAPESESMIDFWRRHAEWTYGILQQEPGIDVDPDLARIAATHHLLENQNPAKIDVAKAPAESHVLEMLEQAQLIAAVDKYQAFRARGGMAHENALSQLNKIIDSRPDLPQELRDKFKTVVDIIDKSRGELEKYFERKK